MNLINNKIYIFFQIKLKYNKFFLFIFLKDFFLFYILLLLIIYVKYILLYNLNIIKY